MSYCILFTLAYDCISCLLYASINHNLVSLVLFLYCMLHFTFASNSIEFFFFLVLCNTQPYSLLYFPVPYLSSLFSLEMYYEEDITGGK